MLADPRPTTLPQFVVVVESEVDFRLAMRRMMGWVLAACARMHARRLAPLVCATVGVDGCYEVPAPSWVLDETARAYGVRVEVVEFGAASSALLIPVPADRTRVEALPGDTVSFSLIAADADAVLGNAELDPAFWVCAGCRSFTPTGDPVVCDGSMSALLEGCLVGRGAEVRFTLPTEVTPEDAAALRSPRVVGIAGDPGGATTDECLATYFAEDRSDALRQCVLASNPLALGPWWILLPLLGETEALEEHPESILQVPDFNPEVEFFQVTIGTGPTARLLNYAAGDVVPARPREQVLVYFRSDRRDAQVLTVPTSNGDVFTQQQFVLTRWFSTIELDGVTAATGDQFSFRLPPEPGPLRIDAFIWDARAGVAAGSLGFDVRDAAP